MSKDTLIFIGLVTHKEFTEVAYVLDGRTDSVHHHGRIQTTKLALVKLVRQFQSKYPKAALHVVYEAGPCGYWIYRLLTSLGHCCYVVAPSLIAKKPGDRVKTDKRDAMMLAERLKKNDLTPIYVPEPEDESIRDLSRARETAMHDLNDGRYQLKAFLLRNNIRYEGPANWSLKHLRWLTELVLPQEGLPKEIVDQAWEAQLRLCRRYQRLMHRGKHRSVVVTAIAREMIAYIWSISREVVLQPVNQKERLSRVPA